jgi:protein-disulfide isomerase
VPTLLSRPATFAATFVSLVLGLAVGHFALPALTGARAAQPSPQPAPPVTVEAATKTGQSDALRRYQVPVSISQPALGPVDALVTVVHFCDFQSDACRQIAPVLDAVQRRQAAELRLVFRHFPPGDEASMRAHELAQIAHVQGAKFWRVRELLLQAPRSTDLVALERVAREAGLDWEQARAALDRHSYGNHVIADRVFADMFEVERAPATFVNGRKVDGAPTRWSQPSSRPRERCSHAAWRRTPSTRSW